MGIPFRNRHSMMVNVEAGVIMKTAGWKVGTAGARQTAIEQYRFFFLWNQQIDEFRFENLVETDGQGLK